MKAKLNEELVYAEKDENGNLENEVFKNPTKAEIRKNYLSQTRVVIDGEGNFYFCMSGNLIHDDIIDKIGKGDNYSLFYDYYKDTFYKRDEYRNEKEHEQMNKRLKEWLVSYPYIKNNFGTDFNTYVFSYEYGEEPFDIKFDNLNESVIYRDDGEIGDLQPQINEVLEAAGIQLNETILDAKSVGDELMNIILKNPTRKELRDNDMNICRGAMGKSGNFYFISLSQLAHCDLFDTLEQMGINDAPYNTFKYSNKTNTFYYYDPDNDLDFNLIKKELETSPYFKNFTGCKFDTFDDTEFDPELYEGYNPLNESEDLTKFNRIAGFYHFDTGEFEFFPRTNEEISTEDDEINDYIHNVHSKDEFTEFHLVRFGIEDIPSEGVVCYMESDTKPHVEKCYYAIMEKYQEELDIVKYELEYYVGNEAKYIFLDRYGNEIMESLNESIQYLNKDYCDTKIITSAYEMKQYINSHTPIRIVYDNVNDWYLVNDANKSIHSAILDDAISAGLYNEEGVKCGNDLMYSERHVQFPLFNTSETLSEEYAMDGYAFAYDYGNFVIYDRYGELVNTPLYKVLGQPKETIRIDGYDENEELDESVFWKGEKINNYEQGYYPYGENNPYDKEDEMIVWKNPSAEWMKHQIDAGNYFRFTYITTTDTLFVWYGENGFHRDTMDITGVDGDVIGTMTRDNIDYWPDDDSPVLGDKLFREKREKFLKTIYPNGYDIGVQY